MDSYEYSEITVVTLIGSSNSFDGYDVVKIDKENGDRCTSILDPTKNYPYVKADEKEMWPTIRAKSSEEYIGIDSKRVFNFGELSEKAVIFKPEIFAWVEKQQEADSRGIVSFPYHDRGRENRREYGLDRLFRR